jgi:GPH family glycoside/pentoside/hexuronide:cation symporter
MFPEVFLDPEERVKAMNIKQIIGIIALLIAFLLPGFIIGDLTNPVNFPKYMIAGIAIGAIVIVGIVIFLIWGPRERIEFRNDSKKAPGFWKTLKIAVKNKSFMWFNVVEISNWYVFGILPMIVPLYGQFVLNINDAFLLSLLLGETFIVGALFISVWKFIVKKIGPRKTWMISQLCWLISLVPLGFISEFYQGAICFGFIGIGLSGSMLNIDLILGDVVDEDEYVTGTRSEGGYWGVTAFFMRLSVILVILSINLVLNSVGWKVFEPASVTQEILLGLRLLMTAFPMTFLAIGIIGMYFYPLHGKKLQEVRNGLEKLHDEKKSQVLN